MKHHFPGFSSGLESEANVGVVINVPVFLVSLAVVSLWSPYLGYQISSKAKKESWSGYRPTSAIHPGIHTAWN